MVIRSCLFSFFVCVCVLLVGCWLVVSLGCSLFDVYALMLVFGCVLLGACCVLCAGYLLVVSY